MKKITKKQLQSFIEQLEKLTHLSPSTEVDAFFQAICSYSVKNNEKIPSHPDVTRLQQACATGECFMEKSIAEQIISSENPWNTLKEFLYFQNYEDLSRLEYLNLSFYCLPTKILFLGGGSLPLTAILLAKNYNVQCKVVDYDTEAVELGRKLIEKLGLEKNIQYVLADAYDYNDTERYDVCYIAALIWGDEDTQKKLLSHIKDTIQVQYFLIRSSHGTRELLYRKVSLSLLRKYLDIEHIIHPKNHIINSIIIARNYE